jgi:Uncharacterized protein conserved in bacteria
MTPGHTITTETTTARVEIVVAGVVLADSTQALLLHETGLPTRYYLPRDDVDTERLVPSETTSVCPFKGDAVYWSARVGATLVPDIAWSYPTPIPDRADIADRICFFDERVDELRVDGEPLVRPVTQWSAGPAPAPAS